jgi:hypothetical protein
MSENSIGKILFFTFLIIFTLTALFTLITLSFYMHIIFFIDKTRPLPDILARLVYALLIEVAVGVIGLFTKIFRTH